jgi:DNA-binding beta-propeller fold protein YncE
VLFNSLCLFHKDAMQRVLLGLVLLTTAVVAAEWQPLFNGRDLTGWTNINCAPTTWSVRDGMILSTGVPTGVLRTLREYENFIVELEWKHLKAGGNAGFFVHSGALPVRGQPFTKAIEVQIIDSNHPEGIATAHGDVFAIQGATFTPDRPHPRGWMRCLPSERRARPAGEWNHYRVECRDGQVKLAVNGKEVSGGYDCNPRKGFICLESEGSECHFRNLRIQELTPSREPPPDTPDLHFVSLYSGTDLTGWKVVGEPNVWQPNDWILHCSGAPQAALAARTLWTDREYSDFELIADWRVTSSGVENAIYVRGSTNAALRLAESKPGWNRSRISVRNDQVSMWTNDKLVSETALSDVAVRGAIGLRAGGIEFANLYIKEARPEARLVAGGGTGSNNVPAIEARLQSPFGIDFDSAGNMYVAEMTGGRVLKIDEKGSLSVIAGSGAKGSGGDGGQALRAQFNGVHNLAIAPDNHIYLADTWNNRIRKIDSRTGVIATVAGTGNKGFSGDGGPATRAEFGGIYCVSLDPKGENLYAADLDNRRIRVVNLRSGRIRTIAGNGDKGVPADGAVATGAPLVDPRAVIATDAGELYILERSGHALRFVDRSGRIRTVAGTGKAGNSGDGGDARAAALNGPKHLCFDNKGRVLIADTENHVIRVYDPRRGTMDRITGAGKRGSNGLGGPPLALELNQPHGVYVHKDGVLYIADSGNHRVVKIAP